MVHWDREKTRREHTKSILIGTHTLYAEVGKSIHRDGWKYGNETGKNSGKNATL